MFCVVALLLHNQEDAELEARVTESALQKVVDPLAVIVAIGNELTVTAIGDEVEEQPFPSVTFTL